MQILIVQIDVGRCFILLLNNIYLYSLFIFISIYQDLSQFHRALVWLCYLCGNQWITCFEFPLFFLTVSVSKYCKRIHNFFFSKNTRHLTVSVIIDCKVITTLVFFDSIGCQIRGFSRDFKEKSGPWGSYFIGELHEAFSLLRFFSQIRSTLNQLSLYTYTKEKTITLPRLFPNVLFRCCFTEPQ